MGRRKIFLSRKFESQKLRENVKILRIKIRSEIRAEIKILII